MKTYTAVPNPFKWKEDMGLTGLIKKTDFPALERITELLDLFHAADHRLKALKYEVLAQAFRHTEFILKNQHDKAKLGANLWASRVEAVQALHDYLKGNHVANKTLADDFGKDVNPHGQQEDQAAVNNNLMQWYQTKAARRALKLSFRAGVAHRWDFDDSGEKASLQVYDTDRFGDAVEEKMSLYVMDAGSRIYCSGKEDPEHVLKHSSFLAGDRVLAAGTLRVEQGRVVAVTGKSGHYRPTVQQMVNLLERLRAYQVDLGKVTVYRENYKGGFGAKTPRNFEPCPALTLIKTRAWPGVEPTAMRIG